MCYMLRTQWAKKVQGRVSALTKALLQQLFLQQRVSEGIRLALDGEIIRVKISFGNLLADEEALTSMWGIKGASGVIPCGVACSVSNKAHHSDASQGIASLAERDDQIPDIACADFDKIGVRNDEDVWGLCDLLATAPKEQLESLQHETGIKYEPEGLLFDVPLRSHVRPASSNTFDIMHVAWSGGVVALEIALFMVAMKQSISAYFAELRSFLVEEGWPVPECFSEQREKNMGDRLKAGASELIEAYPLLRRFVIAIYGADAAEAHVVSLLLLCKILDAIVLWQRHVEPGPAEDLKELVSCYLKAFVLAHGHARVIPKHHELMHIVLQIIRDALMLNCFALERKHLETKASVANSKSKQAIEATALSRTLNAQVRKLKTAGWVSRLLPPTRAFPELAQHLGAAQVQISGKMRWRGIAIANKAVGFLDSSRTILVVVVGCLAVDDRWALLVRHTAVESRQEHWSTWCVEQSIRYMTLENTACFLPGAAHRYLANDRLEVLH